ncbi:MAG: hypothetical protein IIZ62_02165, partial [Ruminococcus sp.]|nr:hypothetical protein [Ruminococcus sp.]
MNTIKFCLKCGHPVGPEEKFCMGCGANIAEMQAQQGAGNVGADQPTQAPQQAAAPQQPQGGTFQQPNGGFQQPNAAPQPNFQQPQFAAQPGFGTPGAAVKPAGDNWFKKHLTLIIVVAAVLIVGIAAFFIIKHVFFRFQKIDAKDLYKIEFKGIESSGVATAKLNKYSDLAYTASDAMSNLGLGDTDDEDGDDSDKAVSPYLEITDSKLLNAWTKAGDAKEARKMRDALLNEKAGFKITINDGEKATGLSNGDKVKCVVECNDDYLKENNIKIQEKEFEVEVTGLTNGTKVDMFKDVVLNFTGNDGAGRVTLNTDEAYPFVRISLKDTSKNGKLSNGDKVVLTARMRNAKLVDASDPNGTVTLEYDGNFYVSETATQEKEFTVEGLKEMKKVDVFEGIKPTYRYAIPYLRVTGVDTEGCSEEIKNGVRFYVKDSSKVLNKGDKFVILAYARSSFTESGYAIDGTPNEDGYYEKEYTVGDDAPTYLTKENAPANVEKFNGLFDKVKADLTKKGVDRTYISGFSAGGKITAMAFSDSKTYLMENSDASSS